MQFCVMLQITRKYLFIIVALVDYVTTWLSVGAVVAAWG